MSGEKKGIFNHLNLSDNQKEFCIVSDIHIAQGVRNDYVFNEKKEPLSGEAYMLQEFCNRIKISGEQGCFYDDRHLLILLGDIINGGECGYFKCYNSDAFRILHSALEKYIHTGNILYFAGNHDKEALFYNTVSKFPRKSVIETIEYNTRKEKTFSKCGILFEHGNKFDCLCSGKTVLGLMGDFASNIVTTLCSPNLEDLLRGRKYYYDHSSENGFRTIPKDTTLKSLTNEDRRVANGALKMLKKYPECHTIICGHTHQRPVHIQSKDKDRIIHYYNSGKFVRDGWINLLVERKDNIWNLLY